MRIIIESPLKGANAEEFQRNFRYLLWCCRAEYEAGNHPIASHLICPWFMDDTVEKERNDGVNWPWMWDEYSEDPHHFWIDLGESSGMTAGMNRLGQWQIRSLEALRPDMWKAFLRGEVPPHTPGFEMAVAK